MSPYIPTRFARRLKRCRNCGIRVKRTDMIYNAKACSEDCADELWIRTLD